MEEIKITLDKEQVYDLELLFRNLHVDLRADTTQGLTHSKSYSLGAFDVLNILHLDFVAGELIVSEK